VSRCLGSGSYLLRLVRVGDGETRVDCLDLKELPTPALETTWSRVKSLFN
jgi:hypothetical protein